jgi:hypothetical protein
MDQLSRVFSAIPKPPGILSAILAQVADFRQPKVQEQGYSWLRPELWTEFDPLCPLFSLSELEDAQVCRFTIVPTSCRFHEDTYWMQELILLWVVENSEYLIWRVFITISARTPDI